MLLVLWSGCASTLVITVRTSETTNEGRSMYMIVRDTNLAAFNADGYEEIQELLAADDPSILNKTVIYPMDRVRIQIPEPAEGLGVYFLFTRSTGKMEWRRYYSLPRHRRIHLELERNRIRR
jgi:hypothetical protein